MDFPIRFKTGFTAIISALAILGFCSLSTASLRDPELRAKIRDAARRVFVDPRIIEAMVEVESGGKSGATSPKGAKGVMQVMRDTADESGIHVPYHAVDNLMGACEYLRKLINDFGDLELALAAYNAGPSNVRKYHGIPPFGETQAYVRRVMEKYEALKREG